MADEKKSKGQQRYGNGPKVKAKSDAGGGNTKITNEAPVASTPGAAPEATAENGADGVPVNERHSRERDELGERHSGELKDMHKRHQADYGTMLMRHMDELGGGSKAKEGEA